jgi:hypothetical protein
MPLQQVIDAEMGRRRLLEDSPIASTNEDPVFFDTDQIPWWAWVKRFHLPEVGTSRLLPGSLTKIPQQHSPFPPSKGRSFSTEQDLSDIFSRLEWCTN